MNTRSALPLRVLRAVAPRTHPTAFYRPTVSFTPISSLPQRPFSLSAPRCEISALSSKLAEELSFEETAAAEAPEEPEFLRDLKEAGVWTVEDKLGTDEVVLRRTYGQETIRILFSISDLSEAEESEEAPAEESEEEGLGEGSFPIETAITVSKEGKGALNIDAVAQDGFFTINGISFYHDADLAVGLSSEDHWKRQGLYVGPEFENLDESLQAEFEAFLEERGINASLALTIPDLAEHKEQKEYVEWLRSVKSFVEL